MTKKAPVLRTYPVKVGDLTRYIEAASPAAAVTFAFRPVIGDPLTVQEVLAVVREKGSDAIEVATSATPSA